VHEERARKEETECEECKEEAEHGECACKKEAEHEDSERARKQNV